MLRDYFAAPTSRRNLIVAAAGNLEHARAAGPGRARRFARRAADGAVPSTTRRRAPTPRLLSRTKDLEQSHICLGTPRLPAEPRRIATRRYVLNTLLGGSMSSRLFQNIREKRGLAYAVFSGLRAYRDAGLLSVYAGCANESVAEVVDLVVEELRGHRARRRCPTASCAARRTT